MNRFFYVFLSLFFLLTSCTQEQYIFQAFPFPSNIKYSDKGWKKACIVTQSYRFSGSAYEKGKRKITLKISDPSDTSVLIKEYNLDAAFVSAKVNWIDENSFNIELWEEGSSDAKSDYSKELVSRGPQKLISEKFIQDKENHWIPN